MLQALHGPSHLSLTHHLELLLPKCSWENSQRKKSGKVADLGLLTGSGWNLESLDYSGWIRLLSIPQVLICAGTWLWLAWASKWEFHLLPTFLSTASARARLVWAPFSWRDVVIVRNQPWVMLVSNKSFKSSLASRLTFPASRNKDCLS